MKLRFPRSARAILTAAALLGTVTPLGTSPAAAAGPYTIVDLGVVPGRNHVNSFGYAINDAGQVTGYSSQSGYFSDPVGFLATAPNPSMTGILPSGSHAYGINDLGQVTGDYPVSGVERAFIWSNGTITPIGTLGSASSGSNGQDINNNGEVAGFSHTGTAVHAFRYTSGTGIQDLGVLAGGSSSAAWGINDAGLIVGRSATGSGFNHAFLWQAGTGMLDLGTYPGGNYSFANDINNLNQVVGYAEVNGAQNAALYQGGTWTDLGKLPGAQYGIAHGINDNGAVVGESMFPGTFEHEAFIWEPGAGMKNLNDFVQGTGWDLDWANDINNQGMITGYGTINGATHAYVLMPPAAPNSAPVVNAGPDQVLNSLSFAGAGSFTDPDNNTWTATVDYGDGTGVQPLTLNPDKTFNLGHTYTADGSYTVTVTVNDGQASGSDSLLVTISRTPVDSTPPVCPATVYKTDTTGAITGVANKKYLEQVAQDTGSGIATIAVHSTTTNMTWNIPGSTTDNIVYNQGGTTAPVTVQAWKTTLGLSARFEIVVTDVAGNAVVCDPVDAVTIREAGRPETQSWSDIPASANRVEISNDTPGLARLDITVNGRVYRVVGLTDGETRTLNVAGAMQAGNSNTFSITGYGQPGASANVRLLIGGN